MKNHLSSRLLSWLLVLALLCGFAVPVQAAPGQMTSLPFTPAEGDAIPPASPAVSDTQEDIPAYADTDLVRVSIVLEGRSTLEAGFSTADIAANAAAMSYRQSLRQTQNAVTTRIEQTTGEPLDVVWNLTLAANILSANVAYGQISTIETLPGVAAVVLEEQYEPCETDSGETASPNMATSSSMIGTSAAYAAGYTGAGTRIAIIDTGLDMDHQSFSPEGLEYALSLEDPVTLLTADEIAQVLDQLNIAARSPRLTAEDLYQNTKVPFGYNYVDRTATYLDHDQDAQGEHGSHVAGIAAANAYIPDGQGGFTRALDSVQVQGVAPDAQIIVMKVFGKNGGAYDSDYMAAIEDAILLGADAVNLSLGSANPGFSRSAVYQDILDRLAESDTVVTMSAGNCYSWPTNAKHDQPGYLYIDDASMDTAGSPGSFTNSLSVASADNAGITGSFFTLADRRFFYTETSYSNAALRTLAGEQEYIFLDGFGTEEDFAAVSHVLAGKIAICSRGSNAFYEKAEAAVKYGAIATVVYNNQEDALSMDLSSYTQTAPCVSITQAEGDIIREASVPVTDDAGQVLYYTGTMEISGTTSSEFYDLAYNTISSFSAWGVPGSLELKPEITAPGGSIYSVNGAVAGGKAYEVMSGTSMAAPQVAGMAALVTQYIRENGLEESTALSSRALAQSLLMSTAQPMLEEASGSYYPVLRQGAGLANVGSAVSAQSYVTMAPDATESYADGKVKAELGDDPTRTGVYHFTFTLHNLTEETQIYTLTADLFTQAVLTIEDVDYMDTQTAGLEAEVTWTVNGKSLTPADLDGLDFNGDGAVNTGDVQAILDFVTGARDSLTNAGKADLNGDGAVTSYDAYLLLDRLNTGTLILDAKGDAEITVTAALTDAQKAELDARYPAGAYVEGYVFAKQLPSAEGVEGTCHSIPILAYYGSWTDPSMFDKGTYAQRVSGYDTPSYLGVAQTNALLMLYHDLPAANYFMTGNPYGTDAGYYPERWAVNSADTLYQQRLSLIRNAAALAMVITNQDGEVLYMSQVSNQVAGAYYYVNSEIWRNTSASYTLNKKVSTLGVQEGDTLYVSAVAIPEYYETSGAITEAQVRELIASDSLGSGAYLTTALTVDDTAPEILKVCKDLMTGDLEVTVQDNRYVASVRVVSPAGEIYNQAIPNQTEPGVPVTVTVDLSQANVGPDCLVIVGDYARNESACLVEYGGEPVDYTGLMYGFTTSKYRGTGNRWMCIDPATLYYNSATEYEGTENVSYVDITVSAAEYVGGYVYMAGEDGYFYVAPQGAWNEPVRAGSYTDTTQAITDMAFNTVDGKLYALGDNNIIYTVDYITCALTPVVQIASLVNPRDSNLQTLSRLAIDDNGTFYTINYGAGSKLFLYRFTLEQAVEGVIDVLEPINNSATGYIGYSNYYNGALFWDHDKDILYFANSTVLIGSNSNLLLYMDLETGKPNKVNTTYGGSFVASTVGSRLYSTVCALYVVPSSTISLPAADGTTDIVISDTERTVLKGTQIQLQCDVYPWNLSEHGVTWESADDSVATVQDGLVTAVGIGTTTITATTVAEPHLTASCTFHVESLERISLQGLVYSEGSDIRWAEFDTDAPEQWTAVSNRTIAFVAGTLYENMLYAHDGTNLYSIDPDSFEPTLINPIASEWAFTDAAPCPELAGGLFGGILGLCRDGIYLEMLNPETGSLRYWDVSNVFANNQMAAVAYIRSGTFDWAAYKNMPSNFYYVMTENGELWSIILFSYDGGTNYTAYRTKVGDTGLKLPGASSALTGCHTSMVYDEASGYLLLSVYLDGNTAQLYAIEPETCAITKVGEFGENVWPVVSLYQYARITDLTVRLNLSSTSLFVGDSQQLTARVLPTTYDDRVTWSSSDETVVTVDDQGSITALQAGTATVTATTVAEADTGPASASCTVTVNPLTPVSVQAGAQILTEDGAMWVTLDTETMTYTVQARNATYLSGAGLHDGKLYGTNSDFVSSSNFFQVDPQQEFQEISGSGCSSGYAIHDLTTAPSQEIPYTDENGEPQSITAFGIPIYLSHNQALVMLLNYTTSSISGWNLSSLFYNMAAISYAGTEVYTDGDGDHDALSYLVLCQDGNLYHFQIWAAYSATAQNHLAYSLRYSLLGNVNLYFDDAATLSMAYIQDGLLIADASTASLYWVNLDETLTSGKIGSLPNVTAISGLYSLSEVTAPTSLPAGTGLTYSQSLPATAIPAQSLGGLNSTVIAEADQPEEVSGHQITVTVTAKDADGMDVTSTNGFVTVQYDVSALTLTGVRTYAGFNSVVEGDGAVKLAYATQEIQAGAPVAALTFEFTGNTNSTVRITDLQVNDQAPGYVEELTISCLHENTELRGAKEATCTEDGYTGDIYCLDCGALVASGEIIPANCPSTQFEDLQVDRWYHTATDFVISRGYMQGISDTLFAPNAALTRGQLVTILYRMEGEPATAAGNPFVDVSEARYYAKAVAWAAETGIVKGIDAAHFAPEAPATREQMVTMLSRYAAYQGVSVSAETTPDFPDAGQISDYAMEAMAWAVENGLVNGMDGRLEPKGTATRAQFAAIVMRLCQNILES